MDQFIQKLPKVELHIHLEGAIPLTCLWEIANKYQELTIEELTHRFKYRNIDEFLRTWSWKNTLLKELEDFTKMAEAVGRSLIEQNIVYAEFHVSPSDFFHVRQTDYLQAVTKGLDCVAGFSYNIIVDLVRDRPVDVAMRNLKELLEFDHERVLAIGLGGSEIQVPPDRFQHVFEHAKSNGLFTTAHAGESVGPESIWSAIEDLQVDRIGHALTAVQDTSLLKVLHERKIGLEMCPLSNVRTGCLNRYEDHPAAGLFRRGFEVSISTDDPAMFQNSLAMELSELHRVFSLGHRDMIHLQENAIRSSFADDSTKTLLKKQLEIFCSNSHCPDG